MTIDGEDLRAIQVRTAALDHAVAANEYVEDRMPAVRRAQQIRNHAIALVAAEHGTSATEGRRHVCRTSRSAALAHRSRRRRTTNLIRIGVATTEARKVQQDRRAGRH